MGYKLTWMYIGQDKIRPSGWQPWANTVVYYPLTEDILDHSWNSYNLTAYGGNNYSFTTNSQWLACINLNPWDTKTYFESSPTIDFSTSDYTFVCKICDVLTSYTSSWVSAVMFSMASNFKWPFVATDTYDPVADLWKSKWQRELPVGWAIEWPQAKIPLTWSNFVTYICVRNHTALTLTSYFDWVYNLKWTFSAAPSSYQTLTLFRDVYDNSAWRFLHGKMRDVIVEEKAWTLQEIQDFSS